MSLITLDGQANGHTMQGNEEYHTPVSYEMDVPISEAKRKFLSSALKEIYPEANIEIIGSYWDYSKSTNEETRDHPNGHYRVKIDGVDRVVCVNNHSDNDGWLLNSIVSSMIKIARINAKSNILLSNGSFSHEKDGLHVHIEEYHGGAVWLKDKKLNQDNMAEKLGALVGKIYNGARTIPDEINSKLEGYTDSVMYKYVRDGVNFLKQKDSQKIIRAALSDIDGGESIYQSLRERTSDIADIMKRDRRLAQHGNLIEKMVAMDNTGELVLMGPDSACYSYFPMMTDNATYDVGTVVYRMFMNPIFYEGEAGQVDQKIIEALGEFIAAYNETTGLKLTIRESLKAAKQASTLLNAYEVGHYLANNKTTESQESEFKAHVKNVMVGVNNRLRRIDTLKELTPPPRDRTWRELFSGQPKPKF